MDVFLSWSGSKSRQVAELLQKYLPAFINQVRPWLSSKEISTGARWSAEIAANLESANIGVICITPENQGAPWILFEAGAISKLTTSGRAMVLRIGLKATDITGPLSEFQSVTTDHEGIWKLLSDINVAGGSSVEATTLRITFDALWPTIQTELSAIIDQSAAMAAPKRTSEDMLQELLTLVRRQDVGIQTILSRKTTEVEASTALTTEEIVRERQRRRREADLIEKRQLENKAIQSRRESANSES